MPRNYKLTQSAELDMEEIFNYSIEEHGVNQAENYTNKLYNRFEWLVDNLKLGTDRDEIKEGYKSYFEGKHTIFYREVVEGIEIIGIPHQSEDIEKHFELDHLKAQHKNLLDELTKEQQSTLEKTPDLLRVESPYCWADSSIYYELCANHTL